MMNEQYKQQVNETTELLKTLPWEDKEFYANYLMQTYYFVCHSTRLLSRSVSLFPLNEKEMYDRFVEHISEENRHELLAWHDVKALKESTSDYPELSITKAFYESQYYKVDCSRGVSLLGYILFLEAIAVESFPKILDKLYGQYGVNSCRFLKVHTEEDPDHVTKAIEQIEALPESEKRIVWENFVQTAEIYKEILLRSRLSPKEMSLTA